MAKHETLAVRRRSRGVAMAAAVGALLLTLTASLAPAGAATTTTTPIQFGIGTYFTDGCRTIPQLVAWATTEFRDFRKLGANSVAIAFPLYTDSVFSNDVFAEQDCTTYQYLTPRPADLAAVVDVAHAQGLQVFLRPLLDQNNLYAEGKGLWRGVLAPTNPPLWFANYLATLRPYLYLAQTHHVEHFAIETELNSLSRLPNWQGAIVLCHQIYHGDLVWNYSWNTPVPKMRRANTSLGIDTYPVVAAGNNATAKQVLAGWNKDLKTQPNYLVPKLSSAVIDEIGILAQDGAYIEPFMGSLPFATNPFDQKIQSTWFTAACRFMKAHSMKGIYYWGPWLTNDGGAMATTPDLARPQNIQPAAQLAILKCFAQ